MELSLIVEELFHLVSLKTGRFVEVHNQHLTESTKEQAELINRQEAMGDLIAVLMC